MKRPLNILFLAETMNVDSTSAGRANWSLVQNLINAGFKVKVITCFEGTPLDTDYKAVVEKRSGFNFYSSRFQRLLRRHAGINLSPWLERKFGFSNTFRSESKSIQHEIKHLDCNNFDLIITRSKGARFTVHHAMLDLPQWHHKWLAYIHDPYPFSQYPEPYHWNEPGHTAKEEFMAQVFDKAAFLGFPSEHLAQWMFRYYAFAKAKKIIIPHQINELSTSTLTSGDRDVFQVVHAGNLLTGRDPIPLIKAFEGFMINNPAASTAQLILMGSAGSYTSDLEQYASHL